MTPSERAREIAEAIFTEWQASCARYPEGYPSPMGPIVERHITAALTIPPGHVRLSDGTEMMESVYRHTVYIESLTNVAEKLQLTLDASGSMTTEERKAYNLGVSHTNCPPSCRGAVMFGEGTPDAIRFAYMRGRVQGAIMQKRVESTAEAARGGGK